MHFSIDRKYFSEKLSTVTRAISSFSPVPALSGVLIQVFEDHIILTGSDSNISIRTTIYKGELNQLQIFEEGSLIIEAKYLSEIVRKLDCNLIDVKRVDHLLVCVSSVNGQFQLNGIRAQEYPNIDFESPSHHFALPGSVLKKIVSQTSFACSDKDQRPVLSGVNFKASEKKLSCTGTDSYRLAKKVIELNEEHNFNITIPAKNLIEVTRSIEDDDTIDIYVDYKKAQFIMDKTIFQTRLLDGTFPDVDRIIPEEYMASMDVNAQEICSVIDRTNFIRNEKIHTIKLECSPQVCRIKTNSIEIGNSDEILTDCVYSGEELKLSCNGTYMLEAIRALNSKRVKLEFAGYMRPIRISDLEDLNTVMIVVPIRSYD